MQDGEDRDHEACGQRDALDVASHVRVLVRGANRERGVDVAERNGFGGRLTTRAAAEGVGDRGTLAGIGLSLELGRTCDLSLGEARRALDRQAIAVIVARVVRVVVTRVVRRGSRRNANRSGGGRRGSSGALGSRSGGRSIAAGALGHGREG